ncbi:nucleotidyltransferase domain-containing protein [Gordonia soli]|uniref:Polymerase nucleotidyl transferase domain-containing protein n=1 Tax=Gordonia soli NBRC 108243 TaxID=1223545 RepID=M0QPA2_9ACTN|nr:nucleotidyltransferase domain-containing protein [Gordonia soli]GAC70239.1 hypothetical protein GS4_33_00540 [Gordonia soli NBRC 108243]
MIDEARIESMADALVAAPGVCAVALGGSRARGTHHDDSDVDLGVYYRSDELDIDVLADLAAEQVGERVEIAGPGEWGPWVDGGAWLTVARVPVDWILRDVNRVRRQRDRALRGEFAFHQQIGHPLGFLDVAYAGEVALGVPLADPDGVLAALRADLTSYPVALRRALLDNVWQAGFLLDNAEKALARSDSTYIALSCSVAALICAHAWHADAGQWVVNEKDLVPHVRTLGARAGDFCDLVDRSMTSLGAAGGGPAAAIALVREAVALTPR